VIDRAFIDRAFHRKSHQVSTNLRRQPETTSFSLVNSINGCLNQLPVDLCQALIDTPALERTGSFQGLTVLLHNKHWQLRLRDCLGCLVAFGFLLNRLLFLDYLPEQAPAVALVGSCKAGVGTFEWRSQEEYKEKRGYAQIEEEREALGPPRLS
jgi:hypothetical protein